MLGVWGSQGVCCLACSFPRSSINETRVQSRRMSNKYVSWFSLTISSFLPLSGAHSPSLLHSVLFSLPSSLNFYSLLAETPWIQLLHYTVSFTILRKIPKSSLFSVLSLSSVCFPSVLFVRLPHVDLDGWLDVSDPRNGIACTRSTVLPTVFTNSSLSLSLSYIYSFCIFHSECSLSLFFFLHIITHNDSLWISWRNSMATWLLNM